MRILHIVGTVSPAAGGPTEVIRMLVRYAPPGYTSELATLDDPAAPFLRDLPFPVHALGSGRKRWFGPALLKWLRKNRSRFDGVIVHGLWEFTGISALLSVAKHPGYVVFTHGMLDPYFKRAYPMKHAKKWLYWLPAEYWVLRCAAASSLPPAPSATSRPKASGCTAGILWSSLSARRLRRPTPPPSSTPS